MRDAHLDLDDKIRKNVTELKWNANFETLKNVE